MSQERRLLAVFAHPDDEMGLSGTLAMYAAQGTRVHLVCATRGEVGQISDPSLATQATLGQVREMELREACRIQGIEEPMFLGYRDSGMEGTVDNNHPDSLNRADPGEVIHGIVRIIRELRSQVVVTFDASGFYGHPDHLAIHRHATKAFFLAGRPDYLTQGEAPFSPERLYYSTIPKSVFSNLAHQMEQAGASMPSDFPPSESLGTPDEHVTTVIDVSPYLEVKRRAMAAHRTQFGPDNPLTSLPEEAMASFLGTEFFQRAHPAPEKELPETSLF